jgi:hypothetical protein
MLMLLLVSSHTALLVFVDWAWLYTWVYVQDWPEPYTVCTQYLWQGVHQVNGHIRRSSVVLANPIYVHMPSKQEITKGEKALQNLILGL